MGEVPEELQPDKIRKLESKCPEIVNFLRKASQLGSPTNDEVSNLVHRLETSARALMQSIEGRVPMSLAMNILNCLEDSDFRDGLSIHVGFPPKIRDFVQNWMADKGVVFEYTEPAK